MRPAKSQIDLLGREACLGVAQGELGILQEQAHIDAPNEQLRLLALKLNLEALRQRPVAPPLRLQAIPTLQHLCQALCRSALPCLALRSTQDD